MFVRFHLEHMTKFFSVIKQCFGRRANHDSMANADEIRGSSPAKSGIKEYEHRAGGDKIDGVISGVITPSERKRIERDARSCELYLDTLRRWCGGWRWA